MKIYFCHYRHYDYENELYKPLRDSVLNSQHDIHFPHENGAKMKTKDIIASSDIVFAEVSHSATGVGIEIGWAEAAGKRIVCLYKEGTEPSTSLRYVTDEFIEYTDAADLVSKVGALLSA